MSKHYTELLKHILDECNFILSEITQETTKSDFVDNETLKRAVVRSLEIIGEATKKIPADVKYHWKEIPWKSMAGMRDKLIHDYFGINYSIVWDVVKNKIPELTEQVKKVLTNN
jgi:uncharacterized protein with HEPN domain